MGIFIRFIKHSLSSPDRWKVLSALAKYSIVSGVLTLCFTIAFLIFLTIFFQYALGYGKDFEFSLIVKILICFIIWLPIFLGVFCGALLSSGFPLENKILCLLADKWRLIVIWLSLGICIVDLAVFLFRLISF